MSYVEILLKLNKSKKILFTVFLICMISGHLMQKFSSKNYTFKFNIFFPTGSFAIFPQKQEIYSNFQSSILTELVKNNYTIRRKPSIENAYSISATIKENNSEIFIKKKKEVIKIFQLQKKNLLRLISDNYNITNNTLTELEEMGIQTTKIITPAQELLKRLKEKKELEGMGIQTNMIKKKIDGNLIKSIDVNIINSIRNIKFELMYIELEKEFVYKSVTEFNNIIFPKELTRIKQINYYVLMIVMFVALVTLYTTYLIIADDFKKKAKKIKNIK